MAGTTTDGRGRAQPAGAQPRGMTLSPRVIGAIVILIAAIWFILVNRYTVHITLWVPKVSAPMWLVLLLTFLGGLLAGLLIRRKKQ